MRKFSWNVIIDTAALSCFLFLSTTGVLMKYLLPPGSGQAKSIWGLGRHDWGNFHFWIAAAFFSIMALHLVLHWNWIIGVLKGKKTDKSGKRFILGLGSLLIIVIIAISPLLSGVEHNTGSSSTQGKGTTEHVDDHSEQEDGQ